MAGSINNVVGSADEKGLEKQRSSHDANGSVSSNDESYGGRPACFRSTVQEIFFVLTTTMAIAMSSFLIGSITVVSSFIGRDLHMSTSEISWISASSSLTAGAFLLFFGRVADMFGRKTLFVISLGMFAVFSLVAGFATSPFYMDCVNGVLGLCSAAGVPPAVGSLGAVYSKSSKRKNYAFACFSAGNPLGFVFGIISSGIATNIFSWRASFYLLAIIYAIFTVVAIFTVPTEQAKEPDNDSIWQRIQKFDVVATLLSITGIAMFSTSLSLAGDAPQGWKTPYVPVLLVVGILAIAVFVYWESIYPYPLMPLHIWRDKTFSLLIVVLLFGCMAFMPASFWLALYMQRVQHLSALETAVHLLPMAIMGITINIIAGLILHRVSNKLLVLLGAASFTLASLLLSLMKEDSSYWAFMFPALCLFVVGADLEFNVANMYVMSSLPSHQQSVAGGIFNTVTKLCTTIGLGINTAIFASVSTEEAARNPLRPYTLVFWFGTGISGASVVLALFVKLGTQGGQDTHKRGSGEVADRKEDEVSKDEKPVSLDGEKTGDVGVTSGFGTMVEKDDVGIAT
ncbi:hypothetical protein MMC09_006387 [Bachmanniomyces sp. S44760]|nr:hypothetical protein [Bachmanniomyces sp. S44760]